MTGVHAKLSVSLFLEGSQPGGRLGRFSGIAHTTCWIDKIPYEPIALSFNVFLAHDTNALNVRFIGISCPLAYSRGSVSTGAQTARDGAA